MFFKQKLISLVKSFTKPPLPPFMDPQPPKIITEGKAKLILSSIKTNEKGEKFESDVFYNPVQVLNRDLTLLLLKLHALELKENSENELEGSVKKVYANDISQISHELMKKNFELNEIDMKKVEVRKEDANKLLKGQE